VLINRVHLQRHH